MWTPGYWGWGGGGYYWVPGTWVQPPRVGVLWTPAYWGFVGGVYRFHAGYWGPHVGYYGGINYGFGYVGVGFAGGRWVGNSFAYNRSVNNVNVTRHSQHVQRNCRQQCADQGELHGGPGGTAARPSAQERAWAAERHAGAHSHAAAALPRIREKPCAECAHQRRPSFDCGDAEAGRLQWSRCHWCSRRDDARRRRIPAGPVNRARSGSRMAGRACRAVRRGR